MVFFPPDLRRLDVNCLTLGQYMQPTKRHLSVREFLKFILFAIITVFLKKILFQINLLQVYVL